MSSMCTGDHAGDCLSGRVKRTRARTARLGVAALGMLALLVSGAVHAGFMDVINMPRGVTPISRVAYDQHMLMFWWCVGIGIVVFGAMFYSIVRHRKSVGHEAAHFHHSTFAEIAWTVVPCVILVTMAIPATKALINMEDMTKSEMTVKVTGYQWKWRYDYIEDDITVYSNLANSSRELIFDGDPGTNENYLLEVDNPIVLPINKKIRLLLTADDVIHAWWVPALGQKKDAIPGYINEIWTRIEEPGVYRGQCAELCGKDHGFMPIVVHAKSQAEYDDWVKGLKKTSEASAAEAMREWKQDELIARGKEVYMTACSACHQPNGAGIPPQFPAITGSAVATGPLAVHLDRVMNGKPGTAMAAFANQLSATDLAAVVTYQRNGLGNKVGDMIQPADVAAKKN